MNTTAKPEPSTFGWASAAQYNEYVRNQDEGEPGLFDPEAESES